MAFGTVSFLTFHFFARVAPKTWFKLLVLTSFACSLVATIYNLTENSHLNIFLVENVAV